MRRAPQRTCVGCRRTRAKAELLRLAHTPDGVVFDPHQHHDGRGVYVCPNPACVEAAAHRGGAAVRRSLRGRPADEVQAALATAAEYITARPVTPDEPAHHGPAVHEHHEEHNA